MPFLYSHFNVKPLNDQKKKYIYINNNLNICTKFVFFFFLLSVNNQLMHFVYSINNQIN